VRRIVETGDKINLLDREYLQTLVFLSERLKITQLKVDNQKITISFECSPSSRIGTPEFEIFQTGEVKITSRLSIQLQKLLEGFGYELPHQTQDATPGFPSDLGEENQGDKRE